MEMLTACESFVIESSRIFIEDLRQPVDIGRTKSKCPAHAQFNSNGTFARATKTLKSL